MLKRSIPIVVLGLFTMVFCTGLLLMIGGIANESWYALIGMTMMVVSFRIVNKLK